ncbi:MAG: S8 family serine peptidase [Myxococcota bacterium]
MQIPEGRLPVVVVEAPTSPGAGFRESAPGYWRLRADDAPERVARLVAEGRHAWLAFAPQPPPGDLPPETDDFRELQVWLDPSPGFGFTEAAAWDGGDGAHVRVADVEYAWDADHEDLEATVDAWVAGEEWDYAFHGDAVLGILVAGVNGYGVDGAAPGVEALVVHPFLDGLADEDYDVAEAIAVAAAALAPGDVLLIEQQFWANGGYCPVSVDPSVRAAIEAAAAAGIVVVEPAGNGAQDLDDVVWAGAFAGDGGSVLVGAGASPLSGYDPRSWIGGSNYGSGVHVQGWMESIVTTSGEGWSDLWFPSGDPRQAYTAAFGGTSGASAQVAAAAAIVQSVAIARNGEPWAPEDVRAALASTGDPPAGSVPLGPRPDVRRLLRTYFLR